jgi:iron-sulfur cluster repair protein YtfE (RIC family)
MDHTCGCGCHESSTGTVQTLGKPVTRVRAEQTVAEVTEAHPGALAVFKEMGINHCCGAHLSLTEAAASAGVQLPALLAALEQVAAIRR